MSKKKKLRPLDHYLEEERFITYGEYTKRFWVNIEEPNENLVTFLKNVIEDELRCRRDPHNYRDPINLRR